MIQSETFYSELKALRISQKIEITEISERTKINPDFLTAIEEGDFSVLPNVYIRLFLRSYANEIGADSKQILIDYEKYTTGKVSEDVNIQVKETKSKSKKKNIDNEASPELPTAKIVFGVVALIVIFFLFKFIGHLTSSSNEIHNNPTQSEVIESAEIQPEYSLLPGDISSLAESLFDSDGKAISYPISFSAPFKLEIIAKTNTVCNVRLNGENSSEFHGILNKGESKLFESQQEIAFDLWSFEHVTLILNNENITQNILNLDDPHQLSRASITADGRLHMSFVKHN
jgi:hypothetical protein